jgi:hypothetical protein
MVYSAGAEGWAGRRDAGRAVETEAAGMTPAFRAASWACIAAARVAGTVRGRDSAAAGWAMASEERTTAGRAAVVAAIMGRLGLVCCFGDRGVVMGVILFSAASAVGQAVVTNGTSVTKVSLDANVIYVNLSRIAD